MRTFDKKYIQYLLLYLSYKHPKFLRFIPVNIINATIQVTENCNCRCATCNHWRKKHSGELTTDELMNILIELRENKIKEVRFTGGEPLVRDDICSLIKESRNLGFRRITLSTNGLALKHKGANLLESGLTDLEISIDGIGETNDRIRGIPGYFQNAASSIEMLKNLIGKNGFRASITVAMQLVNPSFPELPSMIRFCDNLGVSLSLNLFEANIYFFKGTDCSNFQIEKTALIDEMIEYLHYVRTEKPDILKVDHSSLDCIYSYLKYGKMDYPCVLGYSKIYIGSKGDVYSGCWVMKPLANLRKERLKNILAKKNLRTRAEQMFLKKCPSCNCSYMASSKICNLPVFTMEQIKNSLHPKKQNARSFS